MKWTDALAYIVCMLCITVILLAMGQCLSGGVLWDMPSESVGVPAASTD